MGALGKTSATIVRCGRCECFALSTPHTTAVFKRKSRNDESHKCRTYYGGHSFAVIPPEKLAPKHHLDDDAVFMAIIDALIASWSYATANDLSAEQKLLYEFARMGLSEDEFVRVTLKIVDAYGAEQLLRLRSDCFIAFTGSVLFEVPLAKAMTSAHVPRAWFAARTLLMMDVQTTAVREEISRECKRRLQLQDLTSDNILVWRCLELALRYGDDSVGDALMQSWPALAAYGARVPDDAKLLDDARRRWPQLAAI